MSVFFFFFNIFYFFKIAMLVEVKILALKRHEQTRHKLVSRFLQTLLQPSLKYPC